MRVKSGVNTKRKHNKIRSLAKGYWNAHRVTVKKAKETILHAGQYAFAGRKLKKRDFRELWIMRINAAVREEGLTYSSFINKLKAGNVSVDRKILAQLAVEDRAAFNAIVAMVK